jgi:hypothetical protein
MKKLTAITLFVIICLFLVACSENDNRRDTDNAETLSESVTTTSSTECTTDEIKDDSIEITLDNWQDYFEFGYELDVEYDEDGVTIDSYNLYPSVFIKDGYDVASDDEPVELDFNAKYEWRFVFLNKTNLTYEIGGICDSHDPDPDETFDITIGPDEKYSWLTSIISYGSAWTTDTGSIAFDDIFCYFIQDAENGQKNVKVCIQQLPVLTCTEASGKIIAE